MVFRGWRLFGLAGTIFLYVAGILLLFIISLQNTTQRRPRIRSLSDRDMLHFQRREMLFSSVHNSLKWCRPLTFVGNVAMTNQSVESTMKRPLQRTRANIKTLDGGIANQTRGGNESSRGAGVNALPSDQRTRRKIERKLIRAKPNKMTENKEVEIVRGLSALVSFPGSGNTWLRYLLQQSTGIVTGSVYKDLGLMKSGFPAENICNASVLAVKTHEWGERAFKMFSTAILLVRSPKEAIVAEFNRQSAGHVGFASPERFTRTDGRYWRQFVINKIYLWEQTNLSWAKDFPGRLKIVFYDDLLSNLEETLRDILQFIGHPIDESLFQCAISRKEGIYRRRRRVNKFDPFTKDMHRKIDEKTKEVYAKLGRT